MKNNAGAHRTKFNARPKARRNSEGFTLIELLVVIAILAILIAFLLPPARRGRESIAGARAPHHGAQLVTAFDGTYSHGYFRRPS